MKRNRTAGHRYELYIAKEFEYMLDKDVITSRLESRAKDNAGIDLCNTEPFQVQCKLTRQLPDLQVFKRMEAYNSKAINIIAWGRTKRANKNMVKEDDYIIMTLEDFRAMHEHYVSNRAGKEN